jgi:hypothetical protein
VNVTLIAQVFDVSFLQTLDNLAGLFEIEPLSGGNERVDVPAHQAEQFPREVSAVLLE